MICVLIIVESRMKILVLNISEPPETLATVGSKTVILLLYVHCSYSHYVLEFYVWSCDLSGWC